MADFELLLDDTSSNEALQKVLKDYVEANNGMLGNFAVDPSSIVYGRKSYIHSQSFQSSFSTIKGYSRQRFSNHHLPSSEIELCGQLSSSSARLPDGKASKLPHTLLSQYPPHLNS